MLPIPTTKMSRSYSAPLSASSTSSSTGPGSHATDTTGPSDESATATRASSNTGARLVVVILKFKLFSVLVFVFKLEIYKRTGIVQIKIALVNHSLYYYNF